MTGCQHHRLPNTHLKPTAPVIQDGVRLASLRRSQRFEVSMRVPNLMLLTLVLGCSSPTTLAVLGSWGGKEASLVLTPSGGALSYACGAGTVDSAWTLS